MSYLFQTKKNYSILPVFAALLAFLPVLSFAQSSFSNDEIQKVLNENQRTLGLQSGDYAEAEIMNQYTDKHNGITHLYLQQKYRGIKVSGGILGLHFDGSGALVHHGNRFFPDIKNHIRRENAQISATDAVAKACEHLNLPPKSLRILSTTEEASHKTVFEKSELSLWDIPAELVYTTFGDRKIALAWEVHIYTTDEQHYWLVRVDANTGAILNQDDWVTTCNFGHLHAAGECKAHHHLPALPEKAHAFAGAQEAFTGSNFYRVYDSPVEAPNFGQRSMVFTAGDPVASPLGWHDDGILHYNITKGNNVYAYLDLSPIGQVGYTYGVGLPAIGGTPGQSPLIFDFPIDFAQMPQFYKDASITNLFYWNNLIHDVFYRYGFNELSGNFQWNNLGKGGLDHDPVLAEAQDPSLIDNANMFTPPDGLPGRMQMYLWSSNIPLLDGDFDNGVIVHEYGHGISTRLTGGPGATCLGGDEQGGEGWSDFFGLLMTMNPNNVEATFNSGRGIGTYVLNEPSSGDGIRPAKYSINMGVNDYTYADITNSEISVPHGVGFIWCTMLWDMTYNLIEEYGYDPDIAAGNGGNNIALQLVMDGLKLQPCSPTFVEMRDAILAADMNNYGGAHQCLIWEAFAKRGLGFSASSGSNTLGDETPAYDLPPSLCVPTLNIETVADPIVNDNQQINIQINLTNNSAQMIGNTAVTHELPVGVSYIGASHSASVSGNTISFNNLSVPAGSTQTITITAYVNTGSQAQMLYRDDMESGPFNWTASPGLDQFTWTNQEAFSGSYSWFALDPNNFSNQTLTMKQGITPINGTYLRFAHRYNTEATFDGGVVEVSADGGQTWNDLGTQMTQNGYSDLIPAANNPLINGLAFGGTSNGYQHTLVNLSSFAGQEILVRFRFASDVLTGQEGWFIDDVEFVTDPMVITNTSTFYIANGFLSGQSNSTTLVLAPGSQFFFGEPDSDQLYYEPTIDQGTEALSIVLQPNPAKDFTDLVVFTQIEGSGQLRILNAQGQAVISRALATEKGQTNLRLNTADFQPGIYAVHLQIGDQVQVQKLIVQ